MRPLCFLYLLCSAAVGWAGFCNAQSTQDVHLALRLKDPAAAYRVDDPIAFEVTLSIETPVKYWASFHGLLPDASSSLALSLSPTSGVEWFRFKKPGHYRLSLSRQISLLNRVGQTTGHQAITLQSNEVEFDILPTDPAWEVQELQGLLAELDQAKTPEALTITAHRLGLLDMPAAVAEIVRRLLQNPDNQYYGHILVHSTQLDLIVPPLEAALEDPLSSNPSSLVPLLTELQVKKSLGDPPKDSQDPTGQQVYRLAWEQRHKLESEYTSRYNNVLLASLHLRAGLERVNIIFDAWRRAEQQRPAQDPPSLALSDLREQVLSLASNLSAGQKYSLVASLWTSLPHFKLQSLVESLALGGIEYWCQGWPASCSAAILADVQKPRSNLTYDSVLRIPEAERPELDEFLGKRLASRTQMENSWTGPQTAAIVLRAGSAQLLSAVDAALEAQPKEWATNCEVKDFFWAIYSESPRPTRNSVSPPLSIIRKTVVPANSFVC